MIFSQIKVVILQRQAVVLDGVREEKAVWENFGSKDSNFDDLEFILKLFAQKH